MKKKLSYFLRIALACLMLLSSVGLSAQNKQLIDLQLSNVSFKEFLTTIESKSEYKFVYDGIDINSAPRVSAKYIKTNVLSVLQKELPKVDIEYKIKDYQIVLTKKQSTPSTPLKVSGRIVDELGDPIIGGSIVLQGAVTGTLSDFEGNYSLVIPSVSQQSALVFSFIGFHNQVELIANRSTINITLSENAIALSDVIVIGYGSVRKTDATGAVDVIKSADFNKGISSSPESLFNGHIAGVQVTPGSGQPGSNSSVRIRGVNSISASSEPLYVIDGVPIDNTRTSHLVGNDAALSNMTLNPLSMIAASDIESMTVLKDASATAIYGSRGANGVIIINTKGGKEGITSLNFSSSVGFSNRSKKIDVLDANQYRQYVPNALGKASTDWQDQIFRTAIVHDHNLTFSSGNKNTSYRASLSASEQEGIILSTGLERYTLRFNATHKMFDDRLILNLNASNTHYKFDNLLEQQTGGADGGIINNALKADPTQPVYNADGTFNEYAKTVRNPVAMAKQVTDKSKGNRFIGNADATYFFIPSVLSFKGNFGYDVDNTNRKAYQPRVSEVAKNVQGRALTEDNTYSSYLFEGYATFNKTFNKIHTLNVVGGYSWQEFDSYTSSVLGEGFVNDNLGADNISGATNQDALNNHEKNRLISFYGRVNYNLLNKYLFTATVRHDGSSRFGPNKQWATFPSTAVAWKVKEETFMKEIELINDLKVRVGFGITGNQGIGNFMYSQNYGVNKTGGTYFNGIFYPSYSISGIANSNLKWEQTAQWNAGVDFSLLKNKISGSVDLYHKKTTDLLLTIDALQPAVSSTYLDNIGAMTNKGIEFTLNAALYSNSDFDWNANFNIAYNKNEITELYNGADVIYGTVSGAGASGNTQILRVGQPFGSFYGQKFLRIENGEEIFESDDRTIIGSALPEWTLGFSNNFSYKAWDLSFVLRSTLGGEIYNNTRAELSQGNRLPGQNTNLEGAEFHKAGGGGITYSSSRWVESASFLRLDNLTLGYKFKIAPKVIKSARIFATAQNLFVITSYKGYDPEVNNVSGSKGANSVGIDYCSYPHAKTFTFGLNVNF